VFPKSILTIIYYNYSSSVTKWWKSVADFFDSLLSGVTALGFQIILFMPVILRTCRSAGMCKRKIQPIQNKFDIIDNDLDIEKENADKSSCCLVACCKSTKKDPKENDNSEATVKEKNTSHSRVRNMKSKVKQTVNKGIKMKSTMENKKKQLEAKVMHIKVKQMEKIEQKVDSGKRRIKSKIVKQPNTLEEDVNDDVVCDKDRAKRLEENDERKIGAVMICLSSCKSKVCLCLENRTRCFIISMALANFHLLVYVVEVVFILCFIC
jgi:hypothetical protein